MQPRHIEAIVFSLKAATAAVFAVLCYEDFGIPGAGWAAISAVLVIQPNLHSSLKASLARIIANLAGAFGGAALSLALGHPLPALALGVMLTGLICYLLNAQDVMRPAFAAVVIVIFTTDNGRWNSSLDRVLAVLVGCACALVVGFLFDKISGWFKSPAAAVAFAAAGARLLLGARRVDRLRQTAAAARKSGAVEVHVHKLDVAQTASVETFMAWARQKLGRGPRLHVLINNAGGAHGVDTVAHGRDADWETTLQTNVLGILRVTRSALPLIPLDAGASIINLGSVAGHTAYAGGSAYCAAKAGELQITRVLRQELFGTGIRVSTVDPGLAETEFSLVRLKGNARAAKKIYAGMNPLTAADIAETLVWVASRPPHVNLDEIIIKPVDQAAVGRVFRRGK
jgi:NADP-dependent 3-hydroxy acid dehydrogenase YdfG